MAADPPASTSEDLDKDKVFQLPKDTTPTWEVELLLSGALVFSMLQVPGLLDDILFALRPRLSGGLHYGVFMLYFYLKLTSYALICTFVLHLASRAVWVAALGLRSVYPEGVLWDKLPRGPIYREYTRRTTLTLDQMIDRADNRASLVFAFGLLLVLMSLAIMVFTMILIGIGSILGPFLLKGSENSWITMGLLLIFVLPLMLATWIDRRFGERIPQEHWFAEVLRRIFAMGSVMVWGRLTSPILLTVFSRLGLMRGNLLMVGALYLLMAVIVVETLVASGAIDLPGERYLPTEASGRELDSVYYADARDLREAQQGHPYIPSEIIRGPYLRLFVPYVPRRLDAALERDCPQATLGEEKSDKDAQRAAEAARTSELLRCAADKLYPILLDGQPVADLRYDIARDPLTEMRGFVAMIDVRELPRGRHELTVIRPQLPNQEEPVLPALIPFWR
ncbi:MAG: hypothetical protein R3F18_13360 [Lysobacterales bacterium]